MDFKFNTKIKDFYEKKSVLITGASGFIGKVSNDLKLRIKLFKFSF